MIQGERKWVCVVSDSLDLMCDGMTDAHIIKHDMRVLHQAQGEFVVRGGCEICPKATHVIDAHSQVQRWMRRHLACTHAVASRAARTPVAGPLPNAMTPSHVKKITVHAMDR